MNDLIIFVVGLIVSMLVVYAGFSRVVLEMSEAKAATEADLKKGDQSNSSD